MPSRNIGTSDSTEFAMGKASSGLNSQHSELTSQHFLAYTQSSTLSTS